MLVQKHTSELRSNKYWTEIMSTTQLECVPQKMPGNGAAYSREWVDTVKAVTLADLNSIFQVINHQSIEQINECTRVYSHTLREFGLLEMKLRPSKKTHRSRERLHGALCELLLVTLCTPPSPPESINRSIYQVLNLDEQDMYTCVAISGGGRGDNCPGGRCPRPHHAVSHAPLAN